VFSIIETTREFQDFFLRALIFLLRLAKSIGSGGSGFISLISNLNGS